MGYGFIYLHRKISENWIWQRSDYFHWFCHLLLKANFKDNKVLFEGNFIDLKRGEFVTSYRKLASELPNCSEQKIRTFLNLLKKDKIVLIKNLKKATQITICKYVDYQNTQHSSNTVATQQQHSSNTVATTDNKEKKEKKVNNVKNNKSVETKKVSPTLPIEDRYLNFKNTIWETILKDRNQFKDEKEELKKFWEYWGEHGDKDRKMRFEKQTSYNLSRRLDTWFAKAELDRGRNGNSKDEYVDLFALKNEMDGI